ncbi:MAG: ankyrin repeat domain-containing protein [Flavobacteriales bacterium]|nr:ankyrin repeat domain-containing protein [Flavobacteriales bacterium]
MNSQIKILLVVLASFITENLEAQNILLDRDFWKSKPDLKTVKNKVDEGHNPSELNRYAFDALSWALIEEAPMDVLKYLFEQEGNTANKLTHDGRTYIFWAAYRDNLKFMKFLLREGARTDIVDEHGYSLLNFSATTGQTNPALYDFIIKNGANVKKEKNNDGANALLLLMAHLEDLEMVEYFTDKGLSVFDKDDNGSTAMHYVARGGNLKMLGWCIDKGIMYKGTNKDGRSVMHFASQGRRGHTNDLEVFEFLETSGVSPSNADKEGVTPLMLYCNSGRDPNVVKWFLKKGASADETEKDGNTALMMASRNSSIEAVKTLLVKTRDINHQNLKGETALSNATSRNNAKVVQTLIEAGANAEVQDKDGNNLLYYWMRSYSPDNKDDFRKKEKLLVGAGMEPDTAQDNGYTIWHLAVEKNDIELLEFLSKNKADINAKNKDGLTALHMAAMKTGDVEFLVKMVSLGANPNLNTDFEETVLQLAQENELLNANDNDLSFLRN